MKASRIKTKQFSKYKPLVENLRKDSKVAMFNNAFTIIRRGTLLYMAMFILNKQWLQVLVFSSLSLVSLIFLLATKPYEVRSDNNIFVMNDLINLMCSYWIMQINDLRSEPPTS